MGLIEHKVHGAGYLVDEVTPESVFTPEDRTEEHKMIAITARQFISREILPFKERIESGDYSFIAEKMKVAGDMGLLGHSVPEKYGGLGLDKISKGIVGESLGNAGGYSVAHSNHTCIATLPITYFGTALQKGKYLPRLSSGEYLGAYCLTEPEAGSDALAAKTTAHLNSNGTHYLLNGTKIYITNASFADTFIVYAKVDGKHFTAFIVEKDFPGLSIGPEEDKMGIKGSSTCSVHLEDCQVPSENMLGEIGKGHVIALNVLNLGRFNLGFATFGAAKSSFQYALKHASERRQFGKTIATFTATKTKIARLASQLYKCESLLYRTAGHVESTLGQHEDSNDYAAVAKAMNEHVLESAICKIVGSEVLDEAVDESLQIHGGAGFIKGNPIEQAYRDSRINRIFEGTNEINRLLIPGVFFKKVAKGEFDLKQLVDKAERSMGNGEYLRKDGEIPELREVVDLFKNLFIVSAGAAYQRYGKAMKEEQETLMNLADMAIIIYECESVVLRTVKAMDSGESQTDLKENLAYTCIEDAVFPFQKAVLSLLSETLKGDARIKALKNTSQLVSGYYPWSDRLVRNRSIADKMVEKGHYFN